MGDGDSGFFGQVFRSWPLLPFYLGEPTRAPRIAPAARGPARWEEDFDPREGTEGTDLSQPLPEYEFDQRVSG